MSKNKPEEKKIIVTLLTSFLAVSIRAGFAKHIITAILILAAITCSTAGATQLHADGTDWWTAMQEDIRESEYDVTWQEETQLPDINTAYQAPNRAHNLRTYFAPDNIRITPRTSTDWVFGLSLTGYGFADDVRPVSEAEMSVSGNRVEYRRGCLTEWYVNSEDGLEQGFTIDAPPESESQPEQESWIAIEMEILGDLDANLNSASDAVELTTTGGVGVLRYGKLHAFDATGRELDARFALPESEIEILVNTSGAVYPITIDPLAQSPAWTAESNQMRAYFGGSVASAGDVNGDGYSDVIVGACGYDNGQTSEGRAYVYHGSATGLSTSYAWTAESNQNYAWFGGSVASAGDVNGDGYSDVIVGAHSYNYDNNVQIDEGRAYVYHGSATGLSMRSAWTAESNQNYAYFGSSVASAGDVNGDGYSDVIVGAPGYDNGEAYDGRAYVYHGSAILSMSSAWTAESNQMRDCFGGSVASAGDVNGDGYSDVIVGASSYDNGQIDEGRAYVYNESPPTVPCTCGDICANESGWWRDGGALNTSGTPIQAAVDNATAGETICVKAGSYTENVNIATAHLTLAGEGAGLVTVTAANPGDHVFDVTANYVSLSGFTVTGATDWGKAGFYLHGADHCSILDNNASGNCYGIYLQDSSDNTMRGNNANSNNNYGIYLQWHSSSNTLTSNNASSNYCGIGLSFSSNNTLTGDNCSNNSYYGIGLSSSSNNTLTSNTVNSNSNYGIALSSSSNNTLTGNTANLNGYGIWLSASSNHNTLTGNTANSNNDYGIYLDYHSSNNLIYNNYFNNTNNAYDDGNNIWNITKTDGTNIIGGPYLGGNYWSDYTERDANADGLGDTLLPYNSSGNIQNGGDWLPLTRISAMIYVPDDYTTIQAAVNAADDGYRIIVRDGTYIENVNVNKRLTIRSENGSASTIVQAQNSKDHVFEVTADYADISGFMVTGATGYVVMS